MTILVIVLFVQVHQLRTRLKVFDKGGQQFAQPQQAKTQADTVPGSVTQPVAAQSVVGQPTQTAPSPFVRPEPGAFSRFGHWLKDDWLLKLGALLFLIGIGWLVSYAFLNNWIGPMGRIALGLVVGAGFLVVGEWRIRSFVHQGGVFLVLGSTTILLTIFAARVAYDFFTPVMALLVMFVSTIFVAVASVKYKSRSLALGGLILAGVAPLLTIPDKVDVVLLFAYLFVVTLGTLWIVFLTGQRSLTIAALIMTALYSPLGLWDADKALLLVFAYVIATLLFLTSSMSIAKSRPVKYVLDSFTAMGVGGFVLMWTFAVVAEELVSFVLVAWMLLFGIGAFAIFSLTKKTAPFYIYGGISVVFLGVATAIEVSGPVLTILFTLESLVLTMLAYVLTKSEKATRGTSILFLVPVLLSFEHLGSSAWNGGIFHVDFFALLFLGGALLAVGKLIVPKEVVVGVAGEITHKSTSTVLMVASSLYGYAILWLALPNIFGDAIAVIVSLIIYTIIGLAFYIQGRIHDEKGKRVYGATLLGFVVLRLLFVDVWQMELAGKIITFFLVGALLMSTAFFGRPKHEQENTVVENNNE